MLEKWRLIIDPPQSGPENMATDEALLLSASLDKSNTAALRIYGWARPTLSLGYLQKAASFDDIALPVVRRMTGGRALLHDDELTYAVAAGSGSALASMGIAGCYAAISRAIVLALKEFGIDAVFARPISPSAYKSHGACFASSARYEVLVGGKKIAGSAQRRLKGGFLQHGSIIFGIDRGLWASIFGDEVLARTATFLDIVGKDIDRVKFRDVFVDKLSHELGLSFIGAGLTEYEQELKERLVEEKYSRKEWNENALRRTAVIGAAAL